MSNTYNTIAIFLILFLIGIGAYWAYNKNVSTQIPNGGETVYCTLDAMICPDGSAVGRVPPDCEFAQCPATSSPNI